MNFFSQFSFTGVYVLSWAAMGCSAGVDPIDRSSDPAIDEPGQGQQAIGSSASRDAVSHGPEAEFFAPRAVAQLPATKREPFAIDMTPIPTTEVWGANCRSSDVNMYAQSANAGHWSAIRLPMTAAFTVTAVKYGLNQSPYGASCVANLAHSVQIFSSPGATPPASPEVLASVNVPAGDQVWPTGVGSTRIVEVALPSPVTIPAGHTLWIAVKMVESRLCVTTCPADTTALDPGWWSWATQAPYSWAVLPPFGSASGLLMGAVGYSIP